MREAAAPRPSKSAGLETVRRSGTGQNGEVVRVGGWATGWTQEDGGAESLCPAVGAGPLGFAEWVPRCGWRRTERTTAPLLEAKVIPFPLGRGILGALKFLGTLLPSS